MTAKKKAIELANQFVTRSVFDMTHKQLKEERQSSKKDAIVCVDEIIKALQITTGHCELNQLDQQEVRSDFAFWGEVRTEIEALP